MLSRKFIVDQFYVFITQLYSMSDEIQELKHAKIDKESFYKVKTQLGHHLNKFDQNVTKRSAGDLLVRKELYNNNNKAVEYTTKLVDLIYAIDDNEIDEVLNLIDSKYERYKDKGEL